MRMIKSDKLSLVNAIEATNVLQEHSIVFFERNRTGTSSCCLWTWNILKKLKKLKFDLNKNRKFTYTESFNFST